MYLIIYTQKRNEGCKEKRKCNPSLIFATMLLLTLYRIKKGLARSYINFTPSSLHSYKESKGHK